MTKTILTIEKLKLNLSEKEIKRLWNKWLSETKMRTYFTRCISQSQHDFMAKKYAEEKTIQNMGFDWVLIDNKGDRVLTFKNKVVYYE